MSETKHTPGPWAIGDENNECCQVIIGDKHNLVASLDRLDCNTGKIVIEREEMLANARLFAAAPELLAALEVAVEYFDRNEIDCIAHDDAKAAIKKAKGE